MLKLIVINNEIHVTEKARQAKLIKMLLLTSLKKGHYHQFLMICKSKEKMIPGK